MLEALKKDFGIRRAANRDPFAPQVAGDVLEIVNLTVERQRMVAVANRLLGCGLGRPQDRKTRMTEYRRTEGDGAFVVGAAMTQQWCQSRNRFGRRRPAVQSNATPNSTH